MTTATQGLTTRPTGTRTRDLPQVVQGPQPKLFALVEEKGLALVGAVIEKVALSYRGHSALFFARYEDKWVSQSEITPVVQRMFASTSTTPERNNTIRADLHLKKCGDQVEISIEQIIVSYNPIRDEDDPEVRVTSSISKEWLISKGYKLVFLV